MEGASTSPQEFLVFRLFGVSFVCLLFFCWVFLPCLAFLILESFSSWLISVFLAAAYTKEALCRLLGFSWLSYSSFPMHRYLLCPLISSDLPLTRAGAFQARGTPGIKSN